MIIFLLLNKKKIKKKRRRKLFSANEGAENEKEKCDLLLIEKKSFNLFLGDFFLCCFR